MFSDVALGAPRLTCPDTRAPRDEHWQGAVSLAGMTAETRTVELGGWDGPWDADDPDANFKADVALYSHVDPMTTIGRLAAAMKIPQGAVVHYVLARWASAGSGGLLELGPSMVRRLRAAVERAEGVGTDAARLEAYVGCDRSRAGPPSMSPR